jgi:hypothetical protein
MSQYRNAVASAVFGQSVEPTLPRCGTDLATTDIEKGARH